MIIIDALRALSIIEKRKLKEALDSPFINKNEKLLNIYEYLEKHSDDADIMSLKKNLFKHLFPREKYNDLMVRHLISKLMQVIEMVMSALQMQANNTEAGLYYLSWLGQKGLKNQFQQKATKLAATLNAAHNNSMAEYAHRFKFVQTQETFVNRHQIRHDNQELQLVSDTLDQYFIANKLKIACAAYSLQTVYKQPFDIGFIEPIVEQMESNNGMKEPLINLYYLGLQTLRSADHVSYFKQLKLQLTEVNISIQKDELLDLFILAQNYCIRKVNSGDGVYFGELFELYKASLRLKLVQQDAVQFPPAFKNIVAVALRLKAFDWVEQFIKTHAEYIQPVYRNDYVNYNLARVYFEQQDYELAQDHLGKLSFKDVFIGLSARMLLIKVYYELDEDSLLFAQLESFQQYLKRKEIMANRHSYQLNLKYIKRLMNLNIYDKKRKLILREQIEKESGLTERNWMLEKMGEVEK